MGHLGKHQPDRLKRHLVLVKQLDEVLLQGRIPQAEQVTEDDRQLLKG